jgi:hypothetical protein
MNSLHAFLPRKILAPTNMGTASESAFKYARHFGDRFAVLGEFFSSAAVSVMQLAHGPLLIVPKRKMEN